MSSLPAPHGKLSIPRPSVPPTRKLDDQLLLTLFQQMTQARCLEERLIRMQRGGDGYFWIGGPGEEALNISLGNLVKKGQGLDYDYLHLHYRSSGTLLAMGARPVDAFRQMKSVATDPYSQGRNFCGHYSIRKWNVAPISSPIEVQMVMSVGTAMAQGRHQTDAITIAQSGDAGTAEGEFASALIWCSRPDQEIPLLLLVANNSWGISTPAGTQHGEKRIADRGVAFGIKTATINGNDLNEVYFGLMDAMAYVRKERKPFLLEANVSRLYGHSSSSGSNLVEHEVDCLKLAQTEVIKRGLMTEPECVAYRAGIEKEYLELAKMVAAEPKTEGAEAWRHVFSETNTVGDGAIVVPHDNHFYGVVSPSE